MALVAYVALTAGAVLLSVIVGLVPAILLMLVAYCLAWRIEIADTHARTQARVRARRSKP